MSRSFRALAVGFARAGSAFGGLGSQAKDSQCSGGLGRVGADLSLTALSWMVASAVGVMVLVCVVGLAFAPACALGGDWHGRRPVARLVRAERRVVSARAIAPAVVLAVGAG